MTEEKKKPDGWYWLVVPILCGIIILAGLYCIAGCGSKDKATVEVFPEKSLEPIAHLFKEKMSPLLREKEDNTRKRIEDTEFWQILGTAASSVLIAGFAVWNRSHAKKLASLPARDV